MTAAAELATQIDDAHGTSTVPPSTVSVAPVIAEACGLASRATVPVLD